MESAVLIVSGIALGVTMEWCLRWWRRSEATARVDAAAKVLKGHGLDAFTYLAAFGAPEGELRTALAAFEYTGKVVIDKDGRMVGRLLPKAIASEPGLRLVVDNTKP